jgi:ribosome-associated translation inhibitor RaiA
MSENFEKTFMARQYKEHREEVLIEREIGMLQATQPYVEREIKIEKINEELKILREEYYSKLFKLEEELRQLKNGEVTVEKKKFVRKCPNGDCHGFLSTALKCELCDCWACADCREVKGFTNEEKENHVCDKNILESVKMLDKDSKPCPKCSALIFKIEGCDQMYCVECHTAFSWRTLKIETGVIHNPHYFEYQRRANNGVVPRNPLDVQCGRELDMNFVNRLMEELEPPLPKGWKKQVKITRGYFNNEMRTVTYVSPRGEVHHNHPCKMDDVIDICRQTIHIRHVEQPRFRALDRLNDNLQMRIDYMRNKINKEDFKKVLQKKEKENMKRGEISNIIGMYVSVMTDLMYRVLGGGVGSVKSEMNELRVYTNNCLEVVSKTYNCKKYSINETFQFV